MLNATFYVRCCNSQQLRALHPRLLAPVPPVLVSSQTNADCSDFSNTEQTQREKKEFRGVSVLVGALVLMPLSLLPCCALAVLVCVCAASPASLYRELARASDERGTARCCWYAVTTRGVMVLPAAAALSSTLHSRTAQAKIVSCEGCTTMTASTGTKSGSNYIHI